jgi:hypothetical protein
MNLLTHTGLFSVQLQEPGSQTIAAGEPLAITGGESADE